MKRNVCDLCNGCHGVNGGVDVDVEVGEETMKQTYYKVTRKGDPVSMCATGKGLVTYSTTLFVEAPECFAKLEYN